MVDQRASIASILTFGVGDNDGNRVENAIYQMVLQKKCTFLETDNDTMRHQLKDLETSLSINKEMLNSLFMSVEGVVQKVLTKLKVDNDNLFQSLMKAYRDLQEANTKILVLEQINADLASKDRENNEAYMQKIVDLKEEVVKKTYEN